MSTTSSKFRFCPSLHIILILATTLIMALSSGCSVKAKVDDDVTPLPSGYDANPQDPVAGIYKITSHKEWDSFDQKCEGEGEVVTNEFEYFKLNAESNPFSGDVSLWYYNCNSATECDDGTVEANWSFDTKAGDYKWTGNPSMSSSESPWENDTCSFSYTESFAERDGANLGLVSIHYWGDVPKINGTCSGVLDQLLEANRGKVPCDSMEVIEAEAAQ